MQKVSIFSDPQNQVRLEIARNGILKVTLNYITEKNNGKSFQDRVFNSFVKSVNGVSELDSGKLLLFNSEVKNLDFVRKLKSQIFNVKEGRFEYLKELDTLHCLDSVGIFNYLMKQNFWKNSNFFKNTENPKKIKILKIFAKMLTPFNSFRIEETLESLETRYNPSR